MELWIKHDWKHVDRTDEFLTEHDLSEDTMTIVAFEIARNFNFADLWISRCRTLVLDWGWTRLQTEKHALNEAGQWNHVSYSANEDVAGTKLRLYANKLMRCIETSALVVNQPEFPRDWIGSFKNEDYWFNGFINYFHYYEFAREYGTEENPIDCAECPETIVLRDSMCDCPWDHFNDRNDPDGLGGGCVACHESCHQSCDFWIDGAVGYDTSNYCYQFYDRCQCHETFYWGGDFDLDAFRDGGDPDWSGFDWFGYSCRCSEEEIDWPSPNTLRGRRCDAFPGACHESCRFCSGSGLANQCEHCADGLELHGLTPTSCDCHDMYCPEPDVHRHAEACDCYDDCYYWNRESEECVFCHVGCDWCRDGNIFTCETCKDGWYSQNDADICLTYCPTGFDVVEGTCTPNAVWAGNGYFDFTQTLNHDFKYPWNRSRENAVVLQGGFAYYDDERDDPVPIAMRGLWFDGYNAYLKVEGLTLNNDFTLEFWVKNHNAQYYESLLYGSHANIDADCFTSVIRFGIYDEKLIFKDFRNDLFMLSDPKVILEKQWHYAGIAIEWDQCSEETTLTMGADTAVVGTMKFAGPIIDDAHFEHFIGGIHTPFTFIDEFHGFIGSFAFRQDSSGLFNMQIQDATIDIDGNPLDNCRGDCSLCGLSGWCHSNCYHDEYIVGINMPLGTYDEDSCAKCDECCHLGCTAPGEFCGNCPATDCDAAWCGDRFRQSCNPNCVGDTFMCNSVCEHADTCHQNCCDSNTCADPICRLDCPEVDECSRECRQKDFDCPPDYSVPRDYFSFHTDFEVLYTDAVTDCEYRGGHLAGPSNAEEDLLLYNELGDMAWIGFSDRAVEGTWVWEDGSYSGALSYANWGPEEPQGVFEDENCAVYFTGGMWYDSFCEALNSSYACKYSTVEAARAGRNLG